MGKIVYSNGQIGTFIYLKLSFTGREAQYIHFYKDKHAAFPHESTSDQFFDETQFEVYRALGNYVAHSADYALRESLN